MSKTARILLTVGLILAFGGPFLGLTFTIVSMVVSFHTLGRNGITDPSVLAGHIGNSLVGTALGILGFIIGAPMVLAALLVIYAERRKEPR